MNIELVAFPDMHKTIKGYNMARGRKAIMVDGVRWGRINMAQRGCHGSVYTFEQELGETILVGKHHNELRVWSEGQKIKRQSWDKRIVPGHQDYVAPLEDRLMETVQSLIKDQKLRDPTVVKSEQEEAHTRYLERRAEQEREETENFEARAKQALNPFSNYVDTETMAQAVDTVIKAMRWAQAQ